MINHKFPFKLIFLFTLLSSSASLFNGCSYTQPCSPPLQNAPEKRPSKEELSHSSSQTQAYRVLWGQWLVSIDSQNLSFTSKPLRTGAEHWNVTSFITSPSCSYCLNFKNPYLLQPGFVSVTVELSHPFPGKPFLDAFDVKGVLFDKPKLNFPSGSLSYRLQNPDGWTARWSHEPWAKLNPFIDFATQDPERRFRSGETHLRECIIRLPDSDSHTFEFAVDACWLPPSIVNPNVPTLSPHCNEAWGVQCKVLGSINAWENSFAPINVSFHDWQNDGILSQTTLEAPILCPAPIKGIWQQTSELPTILFAVTNKLNTPPGNYPALICIRDSLNKSPQDLIATFFLTEIEITSETPPISKLTLIPPHPVLPEEGSKIKLQAIVNFKDGSFAWVNKGIDWEASGTALNGNPLIQVDSTGLVKRLSPLWWGGTATVKAHYLGFSDSIEILCSDPFADSVDIAFGAFCEPGGPYTNPSAVLGPPQGGGLWSGGTHVCALGYGGIAILEFVNNLIVDGPGPDFIVFENPFYCGGCDWSGVWQNASWCETAIVEVSQDGIEWFRFPPSYDPSNYTCGVEPWANPSSFNNLAGVHPVLAHVNPDGSLKDGIDPRDPSSAGGDPFDLADLGLTWCRFVKLIDTGDPIDAPGTEQYDIHGNLIMDYGKISPLGAQKGLAGFDCDSVAAIHSADPFAFNK